MDTIIKLLLVGFGMQCVTCFSQYTYQHFSEKDGLRDPSIASTVWETSDGYLWFYNAGQLCRFDGSEFEYFGDSSVVNGYHDSNMSHQAYEVAGGFLVPGKGDYVFFKNGKHYHVPDQNSPLASTIKDGLGGTFRSLSKFGQSIRYIQNENKTILYQILPSGKVIADTLKNILDVNGNGALLHLTNNNQYASINNSVYYKLNSSGKITKRQIDLPNNPFWVESSYWVTELDNNELIAFCHWDSSLYQIKPNGKVKRFSRKAIGLLDEFEIGSSESFIWSEMNDFCFYHAGDFINNDTAYFWKESEKYQELGIVSKNEILLSDGDQVFIRNFITGKLIMLAGLENVNRWGTKILKDGKIFLSNENGFYILSKASGMEASEFEKLVEVNTGATTVDFTFISDDGTIYGDYYVRDETEINNGYIDLDQRDGFFKIEDNTFTELFKLPKRITHLSGQAKENFPDIIYQIVDPKQNHIAENRFELVIGNNIREITGNEDICIAGGTRPFFTFKNQLYSVGKSGSFYELNDEQTAFIEASELTNSMTYPQFHGVYLYQLETGREMGDTCRLNWFSLERPGRLQSISFLSQEEQYQRPEINILDENKLFFVSRGDSPTFNVLDLETSELRTEDLNSVQADLINSKFTATDDEGNVWMVAAGGFGLFRKSMDYAFEFVRVPDLDFIDVGNINLDAAGNLMLLASSSLYIFRAQEYLANGSVSTKLIAEDIGYFMEIINLPNGGYLLSSYNRNVSLPKNYIEALKPSKPRLQLKSFRVNNMYLFGEHPEFKVCNPDRLEDEFDYDQNNLTFHFTALEFRSQKYLQFRHKLSGVYEEWDYTTTSTIKLKDLNPGKYTFEIQALYRDEPSESFIYEFEILPPWYETWWARSSYFILVVFLAWGFVRRRTAKLKKRQLELEQTVKERTEEVVEQREEAEKQRDLAHEQKELVEEKNREIMDSITYAKRLQSAILPPPRLVKEWLNESFIFYKPKDIVAGDFYWMEVTKRESRNIIFFAAADCTGHGVPGAMVSVVCSNALNRAINEFEISEPGPLLDKVTELVTEVFSKSEDEVKDGMDIAICALDLIERKLLVSGANNSLYRITDIEVQIGSPVKTVELDGRKLVEYKADRQPVGAFDNRSPFTTTEIQLRPDDCLYIFSDGFADQFGGEKGKKYKYSNFKKLLLEIEAMEMGEQKAVLDQKFEEWRGSMEQIDDVCIIGLRVNGHLRDIFSQRELEIIALVKKGMSSKEIADQLFIAKSTVDTHRKRILMKANLKNVAELISFVVENEVL